jgi:hypothetical protein
VLSIPPHFVFARSIHSTSGHVEYIRYSELCTIFIMERENVRAVITGSAGLIGSEAAHCFCGYGL